MRVLLLNERCHRHPRAGGAEVHLFEVFSRLAEAGAVRIELLCSGLEGLSPVEDHRGVRVHRLGTGLRGYYSRIVRMVRERERRGDVDVIVEAHNKVPFLAPLYARSPVLVLHHHYHGCTAFRQVAWPIALGTLSLESIIPTVYRRTSFLTISNSSRDDLVGRGLSRRHVRVAECGVDSTAYKPPRTAGREPLIVSLGRLEPYKRIDRLLEAFQRVLALEPAARLAVVGQGPDDDRLRRVARSLGVDRRVTFAGYVSQREKVAWLQRAACLVQCSTKEGWGLTVMEAAACATPAVASDVPGLRDSVRDGITGTLVLDSSVLGFASAIHRFLVDDELRSRRGRAARRWAEAFSWDRTATVVLEALTDVGGSGREPHSRTLPPSFSVGQQQVTG